MTQRRIAIIVIYLLSHTILCGVVFYFGYCRGQNEILNHGKLQVKDKIFLLHKAVFEYGGYKSSDLKIRTALFTVDLIKMPGSKNEIPNLREFCKLELYKKHRDKLPKNKPVLYELIYDEFQFELSNDDAWFCFVEGIRTGLKE